MSIELVRSLFTTISYACKEGINGLRLTNPDLIQYRWKVVGGQNDHWKITLPYKVGDYKLRLIVNICLNGDTCRFTVYSRRLGAERRNVQFPKSLEVHLPTKTEDEESIRTVIRASFHWAKAQLSAPQGGAA